MALLALWGMRTVAAALLNFVLRVWWFFDSLPQAFVWGLVFFLLAAAFWIFAGRLKEEPEARPTKPPPPTPSDLAELVRLLRQAEVSPGARRRLARRLARTAVALRTRLETVPPRQAWDELEGGQWPPDPDVRAALDPGLSWWPSPGRQGYRQTLERAVEALWRYAKGGSLDRR